MGIVTFPLMGHDGVGHSGLGAIGGLLRLINLHAIVGLSLGLLVFIILSFAAAALTLEILASLIIFLLSWSGTLNASHSFIITFSSAVSLARSLGSFLLLLFFLNLVSAVLLSVGYQIGLWLLRWEFSRCRLLRVPTKSLACYSKASCRVHKPFDCKASNAGLLSEHVPTNTVEERLRGWVSIKLIGVVFVVDIVSDADELAAIVGAGEEDDGNAEDLSVWDALGVWWVGFEDELVDADWDRTNEEGVEFLVVLVTEDVSGRRLGLGRGNARGGRANIGELPF